jgi:DNA-directed RNA polymerase subunit M/transcription elongation factor TFIIS
MTSRRLFIGKLLTLAIAAPLICVAKDKTVVKAEKEEGTKKTKASVPKLVVTGATLVECGEKQTKITIKCAKCGYKATLEIDTPTADQPYTLEWKCPKCGNKQNIKVEVAKAE